MSDLPVRLEVLPERVALLTLDRPERLNALSSEVAAAIADAVASLDAGASVSFEKVKRCGIGATKYRVAVQETPTHRS